MGTALFSFPAFFPAHFSHPFFPLVFSRPFFPPVSSLASLYLAAGRVCLGSNTKLTPNPAVLPCHHRRQFRILCRICFRRRCVLIVDSAATTKDWAPPGMSGTGLRRAGTGRCYLPGGAAWWGIRVPSSTRSLFGGGRVGHDRCRGSRPPRRWYVAVSGRRTSTSVAIWLRWTSGSPIPGSFFRDLTWAMILWWFLLFGCSPPAAQDPRVDVQFDWARCIIRDVLVIFIWYYCCINWIIWDVENWD